MTILCPCKTTPCVCAFEDGGQISVSGAGSVSRPYDLEYAGPDLTGVDNGSVAVTVTGDGSPGTPFEVSAVASGTGVTITRFEGSDTWVKPAGGSVARIEVIGGGGGGGVPPPLSTPPAMYGGLGGGGAARSCMTIPLALLPDEVPVVVGEGGAGGSDVGQAGSAGGFSAFGDYIYADGGGGGPIEPGLEDEVRLGAGGRGGTAPEGGPGAPGSWVLTQGGGVVWEVVGRSEIYDAPAGGQVGASPDGTVGTTVHGGLVQPAVLGSYAGWGGGETFLTPGEETLAGRSFGGGGGGADAESAGGAGESVAGDGGSGVVVVTVW